MASESMDYWVIDDETMLDLDSDESNYTESDYTNKGFQDACTEDSSSGYASSDVCDTISITSYESRDSAADDSRQNLFPARDSGEEVMNFQSAHALCENLKLILAMPDMCDVTFLVGPRAIPVHGVKAILGTRSRVFYQLILKHTAEQQSQTKNSKKQKTKKSKVKVTKAVGIARASSEKLEIPVKKYDAEVFRMLIQFVHCGAVNVSEDTVAGLYCGAMHFELPDLERACLELIERCLQQGRAEKVLMSTRFYSQHKATAVLFDKIYSILDERYLGYIKHTSV